MKIISPALGKYCRFFGYFFPYNQHVLTIQKSLKATAGALCLLPTGNESVVVPVLLKPATLLLLLMLVQLQQCYQDRES